MAFSRLKGGRPGAARSERSMKKRVFSAMILAVMICVGWVFPALAATYATVVGGWLRLRANPSYDATVITSYRSGSVVTVLSQEGGWCRVLTSDYRIGYMDARYLSTGYQPAPLPPVPTAVPTAVPPARTWTEVNQTAYVTSQNGKGVRLRRAPAVSNSNVLGLYPVGRTVLEIRRSSDGWSYIRIDSKHGYMMTRYLTTGYEPYVTVTPRPHIITPTPVIPTPTPTPAPQPAEITSVKLDPYQPTVGDTIRVIVTPSNAEFTAVWYSDQNVLLSTSTSYRVREADAGHAINVRVLGVGASAGFVANAVTGVVRSAAPAETMTSEWVDSLYSIP